MNEGIYNILPHKEIYECVCEWLNEPQSPIEAIKESKMNESMHLKWMIESNNNEWINDSKLMD